MLDVGEMGRNKNLSNFNKGQIDNIITVYYLS